MDPGGATWAWAHATWSCLTFVPSLLTSCAPEGSHDKILMPKKTQVNLSPGRFLKHKNT
jgi:hypothetical protein